MLEELLRGLYGVPVVAYSAALVWGIFSVLLSPCHLSSIPLVIAFINDQQGGRGRAFLLSLSFSGGILVTLVIIAVVSLTIGILLGPVEVIMNIMIAALLLLAGLYFLDLLPVPAGRQLMDHSLQKHPYLSGFVLGITLGMGLGICALAFMSPVLSISLSEIGKRPFFSIMLALAFILGHCGIILLAGTFMDALKKYLKWNNKSLGSRIIRKVSGSLILLAGVYVIIKNFILYLT